jgi:hypothetical protein
MGAAFRYCKVDLINARFEHQITHPVAVSRISIVYSRNGEIW